MKKFKILVNQDIQETKTRINSLLSKVYSSKLEVENQVEDSFPLTKEQYLEIELGLKQTINGDVFDASEFLNSLKEL